jgi:hypothetical protein
MLLASAGSRSLLQPVCRQTGCVVQLLMSEPVFTKFDALLNVLLSSYESEASKTRATLIKAISEIIRVAPESMAIPVRGDFELVLSVDRAR